MDFTGPLTGDTGGATYARYFLPQWLTEFNDEVTAIFSHGERPAALAEASRMIECRVRPRTAPLARVLDRHTVVRCLIARTRPDVAFFPGNFVSAGVPSSTPIVVVVRSLLHYHYRSQTSALFPPSRLRGAYRRLATAHSVRRAQRIVVPSSATADDLMRLLGVSRRRLAVVPHGVDLDTFRPSTRREVDPSRFLFVSKPWDYKGLATVVRALPAVIRELPSADVRLWVADRREPATGDRPLAFVCRFLGRRRSSSLSRSSRP